MSASKRSSEKNASVRIGHSRPRASFRLTKGRTNGRVIPIVRDLGVTLGAGRRIPGMVRCLIFPTARSRCFGGSPAVRTPGPQVARPPPAMEKDLFEICRSEGCICQSRRSAHPNGEGNLVHAPPTVCSPVKSSPGPTPPAATDRVSAGRTRALERKSGNLKFRRRGYV